MILSAILGLIQSILYWLVVFYLGKILSQPEQLRNFLGLKSTDEAGQSSHSTSDLIGKLGRLVMIIAIVGVLTSVITTAVIIFRM